MRRFLPIVVLTVLAVPGTALAVHWPFYGGDSGRSGNQQVDAGKPPLGAVWSKTSAADQHVISGPVVTAGSPDQQRVIYGTAAGVVHLRSLTTGDAVGPEGGLNIDDAPADADTLGRPGTTYSVSFADSSTAAGPGQVFVVHNEDDASAVTPGIGSTQGSDLEIAQIDETSGALVQQKKVEDADGYTISSSPVLSPADGSGNRTLYFVAYRSNGSGRLFAVPVLNSTSRGAVLGTARYTDTFAVTPEASPSLVSLKDPAGTPTYYVAVAAGGQVLTFTAGELKPGPQSKSLFGTAETPSAPVEAGGFAAGPGTAVTTTPYLYTAVTSADGKSTTVYQLEQSGNALGVKASSPALPGIAAPGLALTQELGAGGAGAGYVAVTTSQNLYVLKTDGLGLAGSLAAGNDLTGGTSGFSAATPAVSGALGYVTRDDGRKLVVGLPSAQPISQADFPGQDQSVGGGLRSGVGQPGISRGYVAYGGPDGVHVYRNTDQTAPVVGLTAPADNATVSGNVTVSAAAYDARGIKSVEFMAGGTSLGTATSPSSGSPYDIPPPAIYSITVPASKLGSGTVKITAVATDASGLTSTSAARSVTVGGGSGTRHHVVYGPKRHRTLHSVRQIGISVHIRCASPTCKVTTSLKTGVHRLAGGTATVSRGTTRVRTRLSRSGSAYLRRHPPRPRNSVRLRLVVKVTDAGRSYQRAGGYVLKP